MAVAIIDASIALADAYAQLCMRANEAWGLQDDLKVVWRRPRAAKPQRPEQAVFGTLAHSWGRAGKLWKCSSCLADAYTKGAANKRDEVGAGCPGLHAGMAKLLRHRWGHKLLAFSTRSSVVVCCMCCGCWGEKRCDKLQYPCRLYTTVAGSKALSRLRSGKHSTKDRMPVGPGRPVSQTVAWS